MEASQRIPVELRVHMGIARVAIGQAQTAARVHFPQLFLLADDPTRHPLFINVAEIYISKRMYHEAIDVLEYISDCEVYVS